MNKPLQKKQTLGPFGQQKRGGNSILLGEICMALENAVYPLNHVEQDRGAAVKELRKDVRGPGVRKIGIERRANVNPKFNGFP